MAEAEYVWCIWHAGVRGRAHLLRQPIQERRMSACSMGIKGDEWVIQPPNDTTARCKHCAEVESYVNG